MDLNVICCFFTHLSPLFWLVLTAEYKAVAVIHPPCIVLLAIAIESVPGGSKKEMYTHMCPISVSEMELFHCTIL
jgi:hypothetical protein